ncbi:leucine-rich repeat flightless-interacting protein 2 isoform X4 [Danio rerio]|uniref:Leucine-rich repeat flightless-interacting protein 2 n=1 Tax=Danio rerio TaxID=7955 RepID=A0A8M9PXP5_DANRE|nr:leucine-rich repeat flightless-interacting protein 2 isoform X3 [Danio rerio]|eukprot:XP_021336207.1 leucine-rich repeat flightless-interacting protein 2 isoform X3 [Danio rerio]
MGTPGSGRKRAPVKDRFSAEDEALSSIAREAEARLAAKRAARAEAREIRMKELERQQKELSYHQHSSSSRKWGQIHQWMADAEKARHGHHSSSHSRRGLNDDTASVRSVGSYRSNSSSLRDLSSSHRSSRGNSSRRRDVVSGVSSSSSLKSSLSTSSVYNDLHKKSVGSSSKKDLLTGLYHDQRNYTSLKNSKPPPSTASTYTPRAPSSSSSAGLTRSYSVASICDDGLYGSYSSKAPSECSWYSSGASSTRSSPVSSSDDDSASTVSQSRRGRRDSVMSDFSDISETTADYFSRSNRRGSVVSDLDDLSIPDLDSLDEKSDKQFTDYSRPSSRCATPALSAAALASLGGSSSRRGSGDAGSVIMDSEASISELRDIYDLKDQIQDVEGRYMQGLKELKESLSEVEEKYKKAMVSNAQLDNEKANLIYQVDTLKDVIEEMEEQMSELRRETEDKSKELERQKHTCTVLQHKQEELKEGIRQRDELIEALERQKEYFDCIRIERDELRDELADLKGKSRMGEKHGLVIIPEDTPNGDVNHESPTSGITVVTQEAAQVLESAGDGPLDVRLRKLADEKDELLSQIRKLKMQLEEERQKHAKIDSVYTEGERMENGTDLHFIEMQRDTNRQISEYKFKLSKAEQEMATMEQNVNRLEGQVSRYKASADNAEKIEDELKAEKRKLQRELRTALDKIEEMEMTNNHLVKRLEKMKANRNALLSQQ